MNTFPLFKFESRRKGVGMEEAERERKKGREGGREERRKKERKEGRKVPLTTIGHDM